MCSRVRLQNGRSPAICLGHSDTASSVTYNNGLICAGGSDRDRHYADVFRLEWLNGKLKTTPLLPSLPTPIANCCGAMVSDILYVAGGIEKPDAKETSNRAWQMDLRSKSPQWTEIPTWPGSRRMLAVAAGFKDAFWLLGGVDLKRRKRRHRTKALSEGRLSV